ncbi:MAG: hypothetical protein JO277_00230 [Candidatus Eremiobacteraeota bacterium]|nr:hypothetical protein [Candidatus Eremiobacteraeota bacterium]
MLRSSLGRRNVLGLEIGVVEIDADAQAHTRKREAEVRAKVTHQASIRFQL